MSSWSRLRWLRILVVWLTQDAGSLKSTRGWSVLFTFVKPAPYTTIIWADLRIESSYLAIFLLRANSELLTFVPNQFCWSIKFHYVLGSLISSSQQVELEAILDELMVAMLESDPHWSQF